MSLARIVARRVVLGVLAIWAVFTFVFLLFTVTRDWVLGAMIARAARGGASKKQIINLRKEYLAERGLDRPLWEQYVDWLGNMFTLQWGESFEMGLEVFPLVTAATLRTALYVVPALGLAAVAGLLVGVYSALNAGSIAERGARGTAYLSFGFPNFWIGTMIVAFAAIYGIRPRGSAIADTAIRPVQGPFLVEYVIPTLLVATSLVAAVVSYGRAYSLQYVSANLPKLIRAKGGGGLDVARHALRNAAIPLVSLLFAETLALLALSVFVIEALFAIDGLGLLFYNAIWTRDLPVLMGGTMMIVTLGVVGNVLQDFAYSVLDPRVDTGKR